MPITYQEFLNENSHRRYPLKDDVSARDTTDSFTIPDSLIVNMQLCAPSGALAGGKFFISSLVIRRYTVDIGISYKPTSSSAFVVGSFFNIAIGDGTNLDYTFVPLPQDQISNALYYDMTGSVTIGSPEAASLTVGAWEFSPTATELNTNVINEGLTQVRSIQVGSNRFYNTVILKEGANVTLTPVYDPGSGITTITFAARLPTSSTGATLESDDDILDALTTLYPPIQTINTMPPTSEGDFTITGEDCVTVSNGSNSVILQNPCATPCCDNEQYLAAVYSALNQLNLRYSRLLEFYNSTQSNIQLIQQKLGLLEAQTGYF